MSIIGSLMDRRRLRRALSGYPVYKPPFPGKPRRLSGPQIQANFDYFLSTIDERLNNITAFASDFSMELSIDQNGCRQVDQWIRRYGALLVDARDVDIVTLVEFDPVWKDANAWANVVHDLGTFIACVGMAHDQSICWRPFFGSGSKQDKGAVEYAQACIAPIEGSGYASRVYPPYEIYSYCRARAYKSKSKIGFSKWDAPDPLWNFVRTLGSGSSI